MSIAYAAMMVTDDLELAEAGKKAINAEDEFSRLLAERGIERG